jgi:membrane-associated phospholipid phosphatase
MLRFFANLISAVINPLMAPTFLFAILLYYFPDLHTFSDVAGKPNAVLYIFFSTFLFAFLLIFMLYKMKIIRKITLENQQDRYIPQLFLCAVYIAITIYLFSKFGFHDGLTLSMLASTITIVGITLINRFWKISTHASGVSGVFAIVSIIYLHHPQPGFLNIYLMICFLTLAVCLSRLYLKVHTPMQIVAGFLLGGISGFLLFYNR